MNALIQTLTGIFSLTSMGTQNQDDQYLAESADIYDLERRMRQVDSGRHNLYAIGSYGIFMR